MPPPTTPPVVPPRSASSSSLHPRSKSSTHIRRPSRLPTSLSSTSVFIPLPPSPPPPPSSLPPLVHLVGAGVDRVLRANKTTRKFVIDRRLALRHASPTTSLLRILIPLFLAIFALLFLLLRFFFGSHPSHAHPQPFATALRHNLARVSAGEQPEQFWPTGLSQTAALAPRPPITTGVTPAQALAARAAARRVWGRRTPRDHTRVSLVAACQDRSAFLQTALPGWCKALRAGDEIVIVDWGTRAPDHVPVANVVAMVKDLPELHGKECHVTVVTVPDAEIWVLSRAYNLAARFARGEWLLKVDCDTMLTERFLDGLVLPSGEVRSKERERLPARADEDRFFYRYFWEHAKTENEQHLNGIFLARSEDFRRINGYDERITTYGWDDSDLYKRLQLEGAGTALGLKSVEIRPGSVSHIKHGDALRGANQHLVMGPTLETQVNSQATAALPSWTKIGTVQETEYDYDLLSKDGHLVAAHLTRTPRALLDHLSKQEQVSIIDEATNRLLHDIYGFPWSVLSEINRSRGELVRSLASLGRSTHWQSGNGFIFAEVGGTVPERLLGMASAIGLAMTYERPLFLAWSSGTREEPTPRITDFFDVDNSGVVDDSMDLPAGGRPSKGARVYQVGRWKCRSLVDICAQTDTAFKMMSEFRSGRHDDEEAAAQAVLDVLHGKTPGKRNILLRLEGRFPLQKDDDRVRALASLTPSRALSDHIAKLGDLSNHLGVYVGPGVRLKGVEAMVRRLDSHNGADSKYFVSGAEKLIVDQARPLLRFSKHMDASAVDIQTPGSTQEIRGTIRDIAELYGLSHCKSMVNDGRPPAAVSEVMNLLKRRALKYL